MNKQHRCDKCGAQALHRFARPASPEADLLFCGHHSKAFMDGLSKQGFVTVQSAELIEV